MAKAKEAAEEKGSVTMVFDKDMFYDGELIYNHGEKYEIQKHMVDRWIKRGGRIVGSQAALKNDDIPSEPFKDDHEQHVIEAETDASLAHEMENDGKIPHREVVQADEKLEDVKAEEGEDEDIAHQEELEGEKVPAMPKKSAKKPHGKKH